ncbi:MAG: acetyl-CoA carboxylase biotin carboxyl carrier protein [Acidobacteriota bacterium]|nr:acetyl-CoA carboxylase biotin carboxyl carrier protein [Acidobacteriota bacterium]
MSEQATSAKKETAKKQGASGGAAERQKVSEPSLNMDELRELASLVNENGFTDFEFENANIRVRLSKNPAPQFVQAMPQQQQQFAASSAPAQSAQAKTESESAAESAAASADENLHKITSPIVGTFYSSPAPDKEPYVKEGSVVSPETTVCIVEAMKLMNEIQAEMSGEVVKIYVENGQPVEYGQPLFGIKK